MAWIIVAATVIGVDATLEAGQQQKYDIERQAEEEKIAAKGKELQRREELNRILAGSAVSQATSGIGIEGTPASIALSTAKKASMSEGFESLSDRLRQSQLKRMARSARQSSQVQAVGTLLKAGVQLAETN